MLHNYTHACAKTVNITHFINIYIYIFRLQFSPRTQMMPTQECLVGFTRMTQCPACKGLQDSKACNGYCLNVMKGCLAYHSQLDQDWNAFLGEYALHASIIVISFFCVYSKYNNPLVSVYADIMEKVKKRLLGPFNIELVVIPINVKISEGIMNFQENAQRVSQKVMRENVLLDNMCIRHMYNSWVTPL